MARISLWTCAAMLAIASVQPCAALTPADAFLAAGLSPAAGDPITPPKPIELAPRTIDLGAFELPGSLVQSARVNYAGAQTNLLRSSVRLDTTYVRALGDATWRAGDLLSVAPTSPWAAPVRLGGFQWQGRLGTWQPSAVPPELVGPGAIAYSFETGYLRRAYAVESNSYGDRPVALASVRAGLTDWLTVGGHTESYDAFSGGALGMTAQLGDLGVFSSSAALSAQAGGQGAQWTQAWQKRAGDLQLRAARSVAWDGYRTVASVQAGALAPRRRAEFAVAGPWAGGDWSFGYARCEPLAADGLALPASSISSVSYSTRLLRRWTVKTSTSRDFAQSTLGGSIAVSRPFG